MTGFKNTFLIDTGADISIFKSTTIKPKHFVNRFRTSKIKGVTSEIINSLGTTETFIYINNSKIKHEFHIVNEDFPIPGDAILGRDFLTKYNCILDYSKWTITVKVGHELVTVPILDRPEKNILVIPPRCEVIRQVDTFKTIVEDVVVLNKELHPGVFMARAIVNSRNPFVRIINTTLETVTLHNPDIETVNLNEFNVFTIENDNHDRDYKLLKLLNPNIPEFVKNEMINLCSEYSDIFALKTDKLTANNFYTQKLRLSDPTPIYIKNYRVPRVQKEEINKQVKQMLNNGIIEPSVSEYNSPVLLVPKKSTNGQKAWRCVYDFRALNKKLLADKFPIARMDDILDQLGRAKWFSVIDLMSGFHQIPLDEESRDFTSFSVDAGSFRFTRLPFGLSVSPNSFQRMMSMAFAGVTPEKAFLYMDDLIVIGCSEKHHFTNLRDVFDTCRKYNLKLNPEKCQFFKKEVTFLGHKITDKGILPDESKYDIINNYPIPQTADEVKRFVAFCNYYRRFIPHFASLTLPLNKLIKKNAQFVWSAECQQSFNSLQNALISPQILQYPDFSRPFVLTTDASKDACGAVLSQNFNGVDLPIAYASRAFTKGELHKPTILKELTAVHWAMKYFRCYLYGQKFIVRTDHRPLVYLFSIKDPSSKLTRMRLDLEEFDFEVEYIKGIHNVGADALSRININHLKEIRSNIEQVLAITRSMTKPFNKIQRPESNMPINSPKIYETLSNYDALKLPLVQFQIEPSHLRIVIRYKRKICAQKILQITNDNIVFEQILSQLEAMAGDCKFLKLRLSMMDNIFKKCTINEFKKLGQITLKKISIVLCSERKLITNKQEKQRLIEKYHEDPVFGGHCGQKRLLKKLKASFLWKNMAHDVANYIRKCQKCQLNKIKSRYCEPMVLTPTPQQAFDIVCIDTIGPFPKSNNGNTYAVTIQCELSKYVIIVPIPNKEAVTVAKAIFERFILIYGPVKEIRTDMGTEYKNQVFSKLSQLLNMKHKISTAYHSQSIGGCERNHRVLNEYMRMYINDSNSDWDTWTQYYAFCYNTTPSTYHEFTPFELVFGKQVNIPDNLITNIDPIYNIDSYDQEIRYRLQSAQSRAKQFLDKVKEERKIQYDKNATLHVIVPGDQVALETINRSKFDPWYNGPFKVVGIDGSNLTISDDNGKQQIVHKNRVIKYV